MYRTMNGAEVRRLLGYASSPRPSVWRDELQGFFPFFQFKQEVFAHLKQSVQLALKKV